MVISIFVISGVSQGLRTTDTQIWLDEIDIESRLDFSIWIGS